MQEGANAAPCLEGPPLIFVSPSQISLARRCRRKWAFSYIAGLKALPTPAMDRGIRGHAMAEAWLASGDSPPNTDPGPQVRRAIQAGLLPTPRTPGLAQEKGARIEIEVADGVALLGFPDVLAPPLSLYEGPAVVDYKFSSARWAKKPGELVSDPQGILYGTEAARRWSGEALMHGVLLRWIWMGDRDPVPINAIASMEALGAGFETMSAEAIDLAALRTQSPDPLSVEGNAAACRDYGQCPHAAYCPIGSKILGLGLTAPVPMRKVPVEATTQTVKQEENVSALLDKIRNMQTQDAKKPEPETRTAKTGIFKNGNSNPGHVNPPEAEAVQAAEPPKEPARGSANPFRVSGPVAEKATEAPPEANPLAGGSLTVLVDCLHAKGPEAETLSDLALPAAKRTAEAAGVAHWKLIDYGKGPGALAVEFAKDLAARLAVEDLCVSVDSRTDIGASLMDTLVSQAGCVIRGIK